MTISSTISRPSSTECATPIGISPSLPLPQCLPFQLRRPINPPPYRLEFEPVPTIPFTNKQRRSKTASYNRKLPFTTEASQASVSIPLRQVVSTKTATQSVPLCCQVNPRDTSNVRGVVYMLHGWAQNVHVFSNRARKLTKRLNKGGYKVVFLQGPHRLPPVVAASTSATDDKDTGHSGGGNVKDKGNSSFSREYAYAWFLYDDNSSNGDNDGDQSDIDSTQTPVLKPSPTGEYRGMDASLAFLGSELQTDRIKLLETRTNHQDAATVAIPPFFLLGFSQGAVLVHKVATLACGRVGTVGTDANASQHDSGGPWNNVEKCILVSGFSFTTSIRRDDGSDIHEANDDNEHLSDPRHKPDTTLRRITIPSFHVVGSKDSRVNPYLTLELHTLEPCFGGRENNNNVLWKHNRGHVLPQDQEFCDRLLKFLVSVPDA